MENNNLIDDAFYVKEQSWGTWDSFDAGGNPLLTSLTEEECIRATRWYLKQKQEGFQTSEVKYDGEVGGKL